ncbi:serine hydrolase [Brevibacillus borstelensis]|uniref:serine hydrolase n=1 Tax=Brevibacillus borstelensis TaxID=45462 RepID=UPI0030C31D51
MLSSLGNAINALLEENGGQWGIYLEDLQTNEVWGKGQDDRFYAASVIKVPIMSAVFAEAYAGKFALDDKLTLRNEDRVGGAGILQHMTPGTKWSIYDLTTLMIIQSDNTATNMLIDLVGSEAIRSVMSKTGMANSQFYNKLMIVPAELEGYNEVTAADLGSHLRHLATGNIVSYNSCLHMINIMKKQQHRDRIPYHLPDPDGEVIGMLPKWELANKTGTVTRTSHDIGVLYIGNHTVTICLLSKNIDTVPANRVMAQIGRMVYDLYAK